MTSISYPHSWYDVDEDGGAITYQFSPEELPKSFTLPKTIVNGRKGALPRKLDAASGFKLIFTWNIVDETMQVHLDNDRVAPNWTIGATGRLATVLGWHEMKITPDSFLPAGATAYKGTQPIDASPIKQLFVYTDIIDNQLVGDANAPLLRRVPTKQFFPFICNFDFVNKEYHKVNTTLINTIEIDIRDDIGEPIPFETGHVHITLHFRQKRSVHL